MGKSYEQSSGKLLSCLILHHHILSLMISLLTLKAYFSEPCKKTVSNWVLKSRIQFIYAIKELCSWNWIKSATQEVMKSSFSRSAAVAHGIYRVVEIMSKLMFIVVDHLWLHMYMYIYIHIYKHIYMCVYMYIYTCTNNVYLYMYIYIYIHI